MKNQYRLAICLFLMVALPVAAFGADTFSILSFDNGYTPGYNIGTGNWSVASRFGMNVQITDTLLAGFVFLDGDGVIVPDYRLLRLGYQFMDKTRLSLSLGSTGAVLVSGLGFDVVAFRRKFQDALATEFKVQVDYLFQPTVADGLTSGVLCVGLAFGIGI